MKLYWVVLLLVCSSSVGAKTKTETAGDIGQVAVPLAALSIAWFKDDSEGIYQLGKGFLITQGVTHTTKFLVDAERPNKSNLNSFPSGHTASAFSGAAFLHHRYGLSYGLPAYMAATYVGYSRIYGQKHWSSDVLVGAALAYTVSHLVTTQYPDVPFTVAPISFGSSDAQGVMFSVEI